jgi:hypothetical protein
LSIQRSRSGGQGRPSLWHGVLAFFTLLAIIYGLIILFPVFWMATMMVKPASVMFERPTVWLFEPTLQHFDYIVREGFHWSLVTSAVVLTVLGRRLLRGVLRRHTRQDLESTGSRRVREYDPGAALWEADGPLPAPAFPGPTLQHEAWTTRIAFWEPDLQDVARSDGFGRRRHPFRVRHNLTRHMRTKVSDRTVLLCARPHHQERDEQHRRH